MLNENMRTGENGVDLNDVIENERQHVHIINIKSCHYILYVMIITLLYIKDYS